MEWKPTWLCSSWGGKRHLELRDRNFFRRLQSEERHQTIKCLKTQAGVTSVLWLWNSPWCRHFCSGTWCTSPDTRSSTSCSLAGIWQTCSEHLKDKSEKLHEPKTEWMCLQPEKSSISAKKNALLASDMHIQKPRLITDWCHNSTLNAYEQGQDVQ